MRKMKYIAMLLLSACIAVTGQLTTYADTLDGSEREQKDYEALKETDNNGSYIPGVTHITMGTGAFGGAAGGDTGLNGSGNGQSTEEYELSVNIKGTTEYYTSREETQVTWEEGETKVITVPGETEVIKWTETETHTGSYYVTGSSQSGNGSGDGPTNPTNSSEDISRSVVDETRSGKETSSGSAEGVVKGENRKDPTASGEGLIEPETQTPGNDPTPNPPGQTDPTSSGSETKAPKPSKSDSSNETKSSTTEISVDGYYGVYTTVTTKEYEKIKDKGSYTYEIQIEGGSKVEVTLVYDKHTDTWSVGSTQQIIVKAETNDNTDDEGWYYSSHELEYAVWKWRNITNKDWIALHGEDTWYYVGENREDSKTYTNTAFTKTLGHGAHDDGTWEIRMVPTMRVTYHKKVEYWVAKFDEFGNEIEGGYWETEIHSKEELEEYTNEAKTYYASVPLVCSSCPEITICIPSPDQDETACDCGGLNIKCDDEKDPEFTVSLRTELEK